MPTDLQDIAKAIREAAPKPCARCGQPHGLDCCPVANKPGLTAGRLVTGGPCPNPGERTEADYLREEVRELKGSVTNLVAWGAKVEAEIAELRELRSRVRDLELDCEAAPPAQEEAAAEATMRCCRYCVFQTGEETCCFCGRAWPAGVPKPEDKVVAKIAALEAEVARLEAGYVGYDDAMQALRAALKAEQAAHAETCNLYNAQNADFTEARATARREAIEECACAAETAEDPVEVFRKHDGRVTVLDGADHDKTQRLLCAAAIRALAPAQKGGEDA